MAKAKVRMVTASVDIKALVDKGFGVDTEIKNLSYQDKAIKTSISETVGAEIDTTVESSVKVAGDHAVATVSKRIALKLDDGAEEYNTVIAAVDNGLLDGVVEKKLGLAVPPEKVAEAAKILEAAGINTTVTKSYKVIPAADRPAIGSVEEDQARKALSKAVTEDAVFSIKYTGL